MRKLLAFALTAGVFTAASLLGQQGPPEPFRLEVNYVEVDAIVTDGDGRFVPDLRKEDFQLLEDGKPQGIAIFSSINQPFQRASGSQGAGDTDDIDVSTNTRPVEGRLYVVVLDDLHTSPTRTGLAKAAARRFVENHVGDSDLVAVVLTSGSAEGTQDFTSNRQRLLRAIDRFAGRKLPSSTLERLDLYQQNVNLGRASDRIDDPRALERADAARSALLVMKSLADSLAAVRGRRKTMLFISEGIDYDIHDYVNNRDAFVVQDAVRDTISAATRANVNIYGVDPRGLTNLGDELVDVLGPPTDPNLNLGPASLQDELQLSQDSLRVLAEETGGFALVNSNDLAGAFDRLVVENNRYYVLGYYSTNERFDGRFRKIDVRLNRPGLTVKARKGYVAPLQKRSSNGSGRRSGSAELLEALNRPLPTNGLSLRANAVALKGPAPNAAVAVTIEAAGRGFTFEKKDGKFQDVIELSVDAVDYDKGIVRGNDHSTMTIELTPDKRGRLAETGVRIFSKLVVPPGRYQFRIGAREAGSGSLGTVFHELEVPDFAAAPLSMSSVLLTSVKKNQVPSARLDQFQNLVPVLPSAEREFVADDELVVFAEVYDRATIQHQVDVTATVVARDGRVMFQHHQANTSGGRSNPGGFGYLARVRLAGLGAGPYVLKVEAASRLTDGGRVSRELQFRVGR